MRISNLEADPDPVPRAAPVGAGSLYAAVPAATPVEPQSIEVIAPDGPLAARDELPLRSWRFTIDAAGPDWRAVRVPHVWSRAEPDLADHRGPSWYARDVAVTTERRHHIRFDALDYVATITVADRRVAVHEGGFTPVVVDLPSTTGAVPVIVEVDDPVESSLFGPNPIAAAKRKIKGTFELHDSRPGGHSMGNRWPPEAIVRWGTGGMTGDVTHVRTGDVRIDQVFVTTRDGRLAVSWVLSNLGSDTVSTEIVGRIAGVSSVRVHAHLPPGASRVSIVGDTDGARAWQPAMSPEHRAELYTLESEARYAGALSDASTVRFGVRSIDMPLSTGDQFALRVDGVRTYVRAANHIPGVWIPELTTDVLRCDVDLARAANLNSLGLHSCVAPGAFYDAADEAGVLVYQDFPLNHGTDLQGPALVDGGPTMAQADAFLAAEMTYLLYNHPCVVYVCGHNEPAYQLAERFAGDLPPDGVTFREGLESSPNDEAADRARAALWRRIDPTRPAFEASGLGRTREVGDTHNYLGSLSGDPTTSIASVEAPFLSEFGAWTPNFCAAERALAAGGEWPPGPEAPEDWEWRTHIYMSNELHVGRPERYPDFQAWAFATQAWAGCFIKIGIESFRRKMWSPCNGHRYHLFADHWGDAGSGVVDRHRTAQFHYWSLAAANRPILPVADVPPRMRVESGSRLALRTWIVNDTARSFRRGVLRWSVERLPDEHALIIGADTPGVQGRFGPLTPTEGDLVVLPLASGEPVASGEANLAVSRRGVTCGPTIELELPAAEAAVAHIVRLAFEHTRGRVENWSAFVAAPTRWKPTPGASIVPRFSIRMLGRGDGRVVRRWTGEEISSLNALPPDQYIVRSGGRSMPVDLYGDVTVDMRAWEATTDAILPWYFDPVGRFS